ncbi:histidine phosphatase family protein [Cytobacillus massiliigabonensis]|uniref:histidine phosphatase family protein n=1 Tax=Cytobacillus massiliigabonensis TaxID=1871011 RepID=UPI000C819C51|nr:histidine phosphatase family protein [Cytobacillus massiliigabonensis]
MTNLYFVRHAHSTYTPDERQRPLSEQGLLDAEKLTNILKHENIDYVLSSPYKRAIQTVEGIAEYIEKEIIIEEDLRERNLSDDPVEDFYFAMKKVWDDPSFSLKGGESNQTAQVRGVHATLQIIEEFKGKNIVIGTHGNIMVLIMNYFDKKYNFEFWKELSMPDIYRLEFDKGKLKDVNRIINI